MQSMKTPITILQEITVKARDVADYVYTDQKGPAHCPSFQCECRAMGVVGRGFGRSKRDAKHEAAQRVLEQLRGEGAGGAEGAGAEDAAAYQHVAALTDMCLEFRLPAPEWEVVSDTGPPHQRRFEVTYRVGAHERTAAAGNKRGARQLAAAALLRFLRDNLKRVTAAEPEAALVRAADAAAERYRELHEDAPRWRPDLTLRISDYHRQFQLLAEEETRERAAAALRGAAAEGGEAGDEAGEEALERALRLLRLEARWSPLALPGAEAEAAQVWQLAQASPALAVVGLPPGARAAALREARQALLTLLVSAALF